MQKEEKTCGITVLSRGNHEINIAMLYEHIGNTVIVNNRILRLFISLFIDEFGEESFGFDGGDVAAVVTPDEDAAFDVEEEQSRSCP
jgi:hypothetical protein